MARTNASEESARYRAEYMVVLFSTVCGCYEICSMTMDVLCLDSSVIEMEERSLFVQN